MTFCRRLPGGWASTSMPLSRSRPRRSGEAGGAAAEELAEDLAEVLVDDLEGLLEALADARSIFLMAWSRSAMESSRSWR